ERSGAGVFFPPQSYRQNALVSFGTHDIATFAGWRDHHDLAVKQALGMDPGETGEQRHGAPDALRQALQQHGLETANFAAGAPLLPGPPPLPCVSSLRDAPGGSEQV